MCTVKYGKRDSVRHSGLSRRLARVIVITKALSNGAVQSHNKVLGDERVRRKPAVERVANHYSGSECVGDELWRQAERNKVPQINDGA